MHVTSLLQAVLEELAILAESGGDLLFTSVIAGWLFLDVGWRQLQANLTDPRCA